MQTRLRVVNCHSKGSRILSYSPETTKQIARQRLIFRRDMPLAEVSICNEIKSTRERYYPISELLFVALNATHQPLLQ